MKAVEFLGNSLDQLRSFPVTARRAMGYQTERLQRGLSPDDWKPMASIGAGVNEIRVRDESGIWRTVYLAKLPDAVYVLHCFQKKTPKTAQSDIALARVRLSELMVKKIRRAK